MAYLLTIYNLNAETAKVHSETWLTCPVDDALEALAAVREGLPKGFGAGLTDETGLNIAGATRKR